MWIFCGYVTTTGVFDDGDKKGQQWVSVKALIGKLRRPDVRADVTCTKSILAKCVTGFTAPPVGSRGVATFDEYGRLAGFDCNE